MSALGNLIFLLLVVGIPCYGYYKKLDVFNVFVDGAKEGFTVAVNIIPYLVGFFVAISMCRAAGVFDLLGEALSPLLTTLGIPIEIIPMALIRPFSHGAANGLLADMAHHHGADSLSAWMGAIFMGSTETTFYVVMVYFGAVGISKTRHAIAAGLIADAVGVVAAVLLALWFFG